MEDILNIIKLINSDAEEKRSSSYITGLDLDKLDQDIKNRLTEDLAKLNTTISDAATLFLDRVESISEDHPDYSDICEAHSTLLYYDSI